MPASQKGPQKITKAKAKPKKTKTTDSSKKPSPKQTKEPVEEFSPVFSEFPGIKDENLASSQERKKQSKASTRTLKKKVVKQQPPPTRSGFTNDNFTNLEDRLNFKDQAEIFSKIMVAKDSKPPLSIGLFGQWGSGKSFFMELLEKHCKGLSDIAKDNDAESNPFVKRAAHIKFNAWHYVDSNLWASLALNIYEGLAQEIVKELEDGKEKVNKTREKLNELREKTESGQASIQQAKQVKTKAENDMELAVKNLEDRRIEKEKRVKAFDKEQLKQLLNASPNLDKTFLELKPELEKLGISSSISTLQQFKGIYSQVQEAKGQLWSFSEILKDFRKSPFFYWFIGIIVIWQGLSLIPGFEKGMGDVLSVLILILNEISKRMNSIKRVLDLATSVENELNKLEDRETSNEEKKLLDEINGLEAQIQQATIEIESANERITDAEAEIKRIESGGLVYDFLEERSENNEYLDQLGLISTIRRDFEKLQVKLNEFQEVADNPIERIVLYIDDLDRCKPQRVVEVLQAVHLLLALDLFVVVVGVDPRWLESSLKKEYRVDGNSGKPGDIKNIDPHNYLEKIFQIPYSLPSMQEEGYVGLVNSLVTTKEANKNNLPEPNDVLVGINTIGNDPEKELLLENHELKFIQALHNFVSTPRLVKRLINIYRILRVEASSNDFGSFIINSSEGHYRSVLLLLAINVGFPKLAPKVFDLIKIQAENMELKHFLGVTLWDAFKNTNNFSFSEEDKKSAKQIMVNLNKFLESSNEDISPPKTLKSYKFWAPRVGRYSFHWNLPKPT